MKFREWAKAYAALAGAILTALAGTTGVLPAGAKPWVALGLAIATAVTTWAVENKTADVPPESFDFDPPAPNWGSAGPAWDEHDVMPVSTQDPEPPKSLYLVPPLPNSGNWSASYYLARAEENEVRVA